MASQGAPELPKWLPKALPKCQNSSQNVKKEIPRPPNGLKMAIPRSQRGQQNKGPAAEGVALKIRRTPKGKQGVTRTPVTFLKIVESEAYTGPAPAAGPCQKTHKNRRKNRPPKKTVFLQKTCETGPRNGPQNRKESSRDLFFSLPKIHEFSQAFFSDICCLLGRPGLRK